MTPYNSFVRCTNLGCRAVALKLILPVSLTAAEATALDPQLRILLEVSYECLENGKLLLLPKPPRPNTLTIVQLAYLWRRLWRVIRPALLDVRAKVYSQLPCSKKRQADQGRLRRAPSPRNW